MRKEYTGALCGLGWHYKNLAVWPEHDIEQEFDVHITTEDLVKVCKRSDDSSAFCISNPILT